MHILNNILGPVDIVRSILALGPVGLPNDYPIEKFPAMEAITYFARAIGAARSANLKMANQTLEKLTEFH